MLIDSKTLAEWRDEQLAKWKELLPTANVSADSMIYIDASVLAEMLYLLQQDLITLTNNAFLAYATGDELSNLWLDRWLPRNDAVKATGTVRFSRTAKSSENYSIPAGTLVATQPWGTWNFVVFSVTTNSILYGTVAVPWSASASILTTGGSIWADTYYYKITAISWDGKETSASGSTTVVVGSGTTNAISLTWTSVSNAVSYKVYISDDNTTFYELDTVTTPSYIDTLWTTASSTEPPATNDTGNLYVDVAVEAQVAWVTGNVAPGTVTKFIDKPYGIEAITNSAEIAGGSDAEDDDTYRARIKTFLSSNTGKVTIAWYKQTVEAYEWVKTALVEAGTWGNSNEITITITADNVTGVPSSELIAAVQAYVELDENRAVCDDITVQWPTTTTVNYEVTVIEKDASVSEATMTSRIEDAIEWYLPSIAPWGKVYIVDIEDLLHSIDWMIDFTLVTPNANITLTSWQIAVAGTSTINFS